MDLDYQNVHHYLTLALSKVDTNRVEKIAPKWCLYRGETLLYLNDPNEAGQVARQILRKDTRNSDAIYIVAKSMYMLASHPIATVTQYLSRALSYDPDNKNARTLFKLIKKLDQLKTAGNDAFKEGKYDAALEAYGDYLSQDPDGAISRAKVLSNRAIVYSRRANYSLVMTDCNEALMLIDRINFPKESANKTEISNEDRGSSSNIDLYSKVLLRKADTFTKTERFEEAVREYETCAAIDPSNREIQSALQQAKKALKMSLRKDYYKILGLDKSASPNEIKKAYRKMALIYHPGTI